VAACTAQCPVDTATATDTTTQRSKLGDKKGGPLVGTVPVQGTATVVGPRAATVEGARAATVEGMAIEARQCIFNNKIESLLEMRVKLESEAAARSNVQP